MGKTSHLIRRLVSQATGIAASTIGRGLKELAEGSGVAPDRVRRPGGGSVVLGLPHTHTRNPSFQNVDFTFDNLGLWKRLV